MRSLVQCLQPETSLSSGMCVYSRLSFRAVAVWTNVIINMEMTITFCSISVCRIGDGCVQSPVPCASWPGAQKPINVRGKKYLSKLLQKCNYVFLFVLLCEQRHSTMHNKGLLWWRKALASKPIETVLFRGHSSRSEAVKKINWLDLKWAGHSRDLKLEERIQWGIL